MRIAASFVALFLIVSPVGKDSRNVNHRELVALPKSVEAERAVLGAAVLNRDALLAVLPRLREQDFGVPQNRIVYRAMEALIGSGKPDAVGDPVLLCEWLDSQKLLESAGGAAYISSLADGIPRSANVEHYAEIVKKKSILRSLILSCEGISERAQNGDGDGTIVEDAVAEILQLASDGSGEVRIREWAEASAAAIAEIESARRDPASVFALNSGIAGLDEITSGLRRKELVLIVGPTSSGKSLLTQQYLTAADDAGYSSLIFSAEMTAENIAIRDVAFEAEVPFFLTRRTDSMREEQFANLKTAAQKPRNIAIVDRGITPERIWAISEARKRSRGLDLVAVDYDQLVIEAGIDPEDENSFFGHQARFVTQAKQFAARLEVCFLLIAQLRKLPSSVKEGKKPTLDDVFGASAMRNAPDIVIWVVRDFFLKNMQKKYERCARAFVVKSRNGRTGKVEMDFDPLRLRLSDKLGGAVDPFEETESEEQES
jgi:replicative DNA helicase